MHILIKSNRTLQSLQFPKKLVLFFRHHCTSESAFEVERITKIINDHPFPDHPLHPTLSQNITHVLFSTSFVEIVLGRLFSAHSNGLKACEFFKFALHQSGFCPSSDAFEKTLHILTRMRYFEKAWELMEEIQKSHPHLLTLKSMSIMLSRIAKFQSYENTLAAFERMEKTIFVGKEFSTDEFDVLLRAFCTQRQMKEAKSVFNYFRSRFTPTTKTMNILLLGFKESGDITSVELFYHEMIKRGFKPNCITYSIRIDAYCKKGNFGHGLILLEEMERVGFSPTLETITTLIHGAGVARNIPKAKELFNEISRRNLGLDVGAYNALISSLIRNRDVKPAAILMDEMEKKGIVADNITYHTLFLGLMKSKGIDSVFELYSKMIDREFLPKTRTIVMLMKWFCVNDRLDLGLNLWGYLVNRGCCPHGHALDLLVTGLCSRGRVTEAFKCSKQMMERGRSISDSMFLMLERSLMEVGQVEKVEEMKQMMKRLRTILPPPREYDIDDICTATADGNYNGKGVLSN